MKKSLSALRVSKDVYIQGVVLAIAGIFALIFPTGKSLAMFSKVSSMSAAGSSQSDNTSTQPLFTRQHHSFQVAIDTLADGASTTSNPELQAYYQGLLDRIAQGRIVAQPKTDSK